MVYCGRIWHVDLLVPHAGDAGVPVAELIDRGEAKVNYVEVNAPTGHDTFLINMDEMGPPIAEHLRD